MIRNEYDSVDIFQVNTRIFATNFSCHSDALHHSNRDEASRQNDRTSSVARLPETMSSLFEEDYQLFFCKISHSLSCIAWVIDTWVKMNRSQWVKGCTIKAAHVWCNLLFAMWIHEFAVIIVRHTVNSVFDCGIRWTLNTAALWSNVLARRQLLDLLDQQEIIYWIYYEFNQTEKSRLQNDM